MLTSQNLPKTGKNLSKDCGFSTAAGAMNVPTDIVYAKLASMVKGAQIAEQMAKAHYIQVKGKGAGYPEEKAHVPQAVIGA